MPQTYTVRHSTPLDDESVPAGVMAIDDAQTIEVVSAEPDFAEQLELAAEMANGSDNFLLLAPPKDLNTRAIRKRLVPRTAPDARQALITMLAEKYGFELTPAG